VKEVVAAFYQHAEAYYVGPDGRPTSELAVYVPVLKPRSVTQLRQPRQKC
jgi:hypothetical protein